MGDTDGNWSTEPFLMAQDGIYWIPPPLPSSSSAFSRSTCPWNENFYSLVVFLEMMEHAIKDGVEVEVIVQMTEEEEGEEIEVEIVIEDRHHQIASEVS